VPTRRDSSGIFSSRDRALLLRLARSSTRADQYRCLKRLRVHADKAGNRRFTLKVSEFLLSAGDSRTRWGILSVVGRFAHRHPALVWPLVRRWGCSTNEDIRLAIACCVLEHVLESHFRKYFRACRELASKNDRFHDTLKKASRWVRAHLGRQAEPLISFLSQRSSSGCPYLPRGG
jgi:hypothetical protein